MTLSVLMPLAERPTWRGRMHSWAFIVSIPAGICLILASDQAAERTSASIYAATLLLVFGTSAAYHRLARTDRVRRIMQRLDHTMIYLLIAGTYVPVCLVALPRSWGIPMLSVVGALALIGMTIKLGGFQRIQWVGYALYPVMGWALVVAFPVLADNLSDLQLGLIVAGGLAYTIGFPVLLIKRPNPWPTVFGYHEVWHSFTVIAAGLHFVAVSSVLA
jgi:hemolysin III